MTEDDLKKYIDNLFKDRFIESPDLKRDIGRFDKLRGKDFKQIAAKHGLTFDSLLKNISENNFYRELDIFQPVIKKRNRKPEYSILLKCKEAMEEWLDNGVSLPTACELSGVTTKTVRRRIHSVLELVEPQKREKWKSILKSLGEIT